MFSKYIWITVFVFILIFITLIFIGRTALKLKLHYFVNLNKCLKHLEFRATCLSVFYTVYLICFVSFFRRIIKQKDHLMLLKVRYCKCSKKLYRAFTYNICTINVRSICLPLPPKKGKIYA